MKKQHLLIPAFLYLGLLSAKGQCNLSLSMSSVSNVSCYGGNNGSATVPSPFDTTYNYNGVVQHFAVPVGCTSLSITIAGGGGGQSILGSNIDPGGPGAVFTAICNTVPGDILSIVSASSGDESYYFTGGGGGGGSFVYDSNTVSLLAVAGGGGGAGTIVPFKFVLPGGPAGTDLVNNTIPSVVDSLSYYYNGRTNGTNGTGGNGGGAFIDASRLQPGCGGGGAGWYSNGGNSVLGQVMGGNDRANGFAHALGSSYVNGGYGGGGGAGFVTDIEYHVYNGGGGGGGGGYNGGGSGGFFTTGQPAYSVGPGGEGGASYLNGTVVDTAVATNMGNGYVTLKYNYGGTAPYTYLWSDANHQTTHTATGLSAGTYTLTVTDNNNCSATLSFTVTQPTNLAANGTVTANVNCNGGNGTAQSAPTGGTSPYTYLWSNGTTVSAIAATAGSYTVTVHDANGCTATASVTITQPTLLTTTASTTANVSCNGGNNGNAIASPSGGQTPYTYLWSDAGSQTNVTASGLTAGSYTVTVHDAHNCSATASVSISQPTALTTTASATANVSCNGGNNGNAIASPSGGLTPYTYSWSIGGTTVSVNNPTGAILTFGTYIVTVKDANGCTATASATISQPSALLYASAGVVNNVLCPGASNGKASSTAVGGVSPYTYSWLNASSSVVATLQSPNTLSAGSYTVTIHDNCGASVSASVTITQPRSLTGTITATTNVACFGGNGGTATVTVAGGTYPYYYNWSPGGSTLATAAGLSAGTYTCAITDHAGCPGSNSPSATITQPTALAETLQSISYPGCNGGMGSATVLEAGGTSPYTYTWTGGLSTTATCTKLIAGSYTVTVKDKNGCSSSIGIILTQPPAIRDSSILADKVNVNCNGGNNASITLGTKYGTPPYTYTWTPNVSSTSVANSLTAGTYTVKVADHNGCSSSATATITQPAAALGASFTGKTCSNSLVSVTATATGGTSPYSYLWSPGGITTALVSGLAPGTYSVTITDKHGCSYILSGNLSCPEIKPHSEEDIAGNATCCAGLDNITLYPNPNNGQFTITVESEKLKVESNTVEIYNMLGQKVCTQLLITNYSLLINISDQPNGIYLIRILDNNGNLVSQKKVVKTN